MANLGKNIYFRISDGDRETIQKMADAEGLKMADILRRAVRMYLQGGAEKYLKVQEQQAAYAVRETTPEEEAGAWLRNLPDDTRYLIWRIGEALRDLPSDAWPPERLRKALGIPRTRGKSRKGKG